LGEESKKDENESELGLLENESKKEEVDSFLRSEVEDLEDMESNQDS
jgi:hypothetical protein